MSSIINRYPSFDLSELIPELEFSTKRYASIQPVQAGDYILFDLENQYDRWVQFYGGAQTHGPIKTKHLFNQPLVLAFYSPQWGVAGLKQLQHFNAISSEIKANGGNLLIVIPENYDNLGKIAWEQSLSLSFYIDTDHQLAKKLRIYSDDNPAWNRFSGIDTNASLPAVYVLDTNKQVAYQHIDKEVSGAVPTEDIINAVYYSALKTNTRKSA